MRSRGFRQVDVFTDVPHLGNPVAVVLEGDDLSDEAMAGFARWTNLSETTFLLPPTSEGADEGADYRLRIFTPSGELPFAGHPTLGSCHAWLNAGATPRDPERIVQECGVGLVELRRDGTRLAFAAPERLREGVLDDALVDRIAAGVGVDRGAILAHAWVDNGPGWCAVRLSSAAEVLALRADFGVLGDTKLGVVGPYGAGADGAAEGPGGAAFEVRAFFPAAPDADGVVRTGFEDPVTGSLNASLAQWLREDGVAPASYVASQGTALRRAGRVHVVDDGERIWVGGDAVVCIAGVVAL
ncbi:PhzF family phenazine biosynthesis protein [Patulibacter minatonensis]|uniref:PhzF family phenazine biosynthesis protein n=1 Tax=Patulibacter minatonensis TaxID=298163 RepID=UPI00047E1509|nr:PhzF family phenazine biosynthesis protein [Patulibacter minatonensis]